MLRRLLLAAFLIGCAAPGVTAQQDQVGTRIYVALYKISYSDIPEWTESYYDQLNEKCGPQRFHSRHHVADVVALRIHHQLKCLSRLDKERADDDCRHAFKERVQPGLSALGKRGERDERQNHTDDQ